MSELRSPDRIQLGVVENPENKDKAGSKSRNNLKKWKLDALTRVGGVILAGAALVNLVDLAASLHAAPKDENATSNSRDIGNKEGSGPRVVTDRLLSEDSIQGNSGVSRVESGIVSKAELQSRLIKNVFAHPSDFELAAINAKVGLYKKEVKKDVDLVQMQVFLNGWGDHLEIQAKKYGLDPEIVKGMVLIESSGDPEAVSPTGAVGVAQLMPDAAERFGVDPENSFEAIIGMCEYLDELRSHFGGDLGMAIWAYHAGEGNVMNALRYYFIDKHNIDIGNYEKSLKMPTDGMRLRIERNAQELIKKHDVNVFRLLQNKAVGENVLADLEDDTGNYVPKAIAGAMLLRD